MGPEVWSLKKDDISVVGTQLLEAIHHPRTQELFISEDFFIRRRVLINNCFLQKFYHSCSEQSGSITQQALWFQRDSSCFMHQELLDLWF